MQIHPLRRGWEIVFCKGKRDTVRVSEGHSHAHRKIHTHTHMLYKSVEVQYIAKTRKYYKRSIKKMLH